MTCEHCGRETHGGYCDCMIVNGKFKGAWWRNKEELPVSKLGKDQFNKFMVSIFRKALLEISQQEEIEDVEGNKKPSVEMEIANAALEQEKALKGEAGKEDPLYLQVFRNVSEQVEDLPKADVLQLTEIMKTFLARHGK